MLCLFLQRRRLNFIISNLRRLLKSKAEEQRAIYRLTKRVMEESLYSHWQQCTDTNVLVSIVNRAEKNSAQCMFDLCKEDMEEQKSKTTASTAVGTSATANSSSTAVKQQQNKPEQKTTETIKIVINKYMLGNSKAEDHITFDDFHFAVQNLLFDYEFIQSFHQQIHNLLFTAVAGMIAGSIISASK